MFEPSQQLRDADRLAHTARRSARWYAHYLIGYALGTVLLALLVGAFPGAVGAMVGGGVWLLLLAGLTVYQRRQQATITRLGEVHLIVVTTWTSLWIITVLAGSFFFPGDLGWWMPAGVVTALPPLLGAVIVHRQTR